MFSSARGMAICIGVTGVASILLWFYFKNRIENVESKLDSMFVMIQNFSEESSPREETQVYNERVEDPFENRELQYVNEMVSKQLPQEESNENVKLITVSDNEEEEKVNENELFHTNITNFFTNLFFYSDFYVYFSTKLIISSGRK